MNIYIYIYIERERERERERDILKMNTIFRKMPPWKKRIVD
jgi:hypothetical protein